jgi:hypothetical protein
MEDITISMSTCNGFTWTRYATKKTSKSRRLHVQRCAAIRHRRLASVRGSNTLVVLGWSALLILESLWNLLHRSTRDLMAMANLAIVETHKISPKSGLQASTLISVVAGGCSKMKSDLPVTCL